jgi:hypothetical protein
MARRDGAPIPAKESKMSSDLLSPDKLTGTIAEAAKVIPCGLNQAYESAHRGQIPVKRFGKKIVVLWQPFLKMLRGELTTP